MNYNTLPMGKYQRIINVLKNTKDDIDAHIGILAIIYEKSEDEIGDLPLEEYMKMSESVSFLLQPMPKFKARAKDKYVIGDMVLIPVKDVKKFTAAQYIDYQTFLKEENRMVELVSTLLVPKGCTYGNGYDMTDVYDAVEMMPVSDVAELSAFFLKKFQQSINYSLICLELQLKMTTRRKERKEILKAVKHLRNSVRSGVGFPRFTR